MGIGVREATVVNKCISCFRITTVPSRGLPQCEICEPKSRSLHIPALVSRVYDALKRDLQASGKNLVFFLPFEDLPRRPNRSKGPYRGDELIWAWELEKSAPSKRIRRPPQGKYGYTKESLLHPPVIMEGNDDWLETGEMYVRYVNFAATTSFR